MHAAIKVIILGTDNPLNISLLTPVILLNQSHNPDTTTLLLSPIYCHSFWHSCTTHFGRYSTCFLVYILLSIIINWPGTQYDSQLQERVTYYCFLPIAVTFQHYGSKCTPSSLALSQACLPTSPLSRPTTVNTDIHSEPYLFDLPGLFAALMARLFSPYS